MAIVAPPDPNELMRRMAPRMGPPVQNMGGFTTNTTAPLAQRPMGVPMRPRMGRPGPPPMGMVPPMPQPGTPTGVQYGPSPRVGGLPFKAVPTTPIGRVSPTPVPAPGAPAPLPGAPAPAPGAPAPAPTPGAPSATDLYGKFGGAGAAPGTLEAQMRDYINRAMGGVTTKAFIDRAKNQLGSATEGQRMQNVNRANEDAIRRGLFRSGIPSEQAAAAGTAAQGAFSSGLANILSQAEQQDIAGRESAAGVAGNLLGMNRQWDAAEQARREAAAARAAGNAPKMFTYIDPDTGQSYEMDERWFY